MQTAEDDTTVRFTYTHEVPENPFRWLEVPGDFRTLTARLDTHPNTNYTFTLPNGEVARIPHNSSLIGTSVHAGEWTRWAPYVYCSSGGYYNIETPLAIMQGNLFNLQAGMCMNLLPKQSATPLFKELHLRGKPYPFGWNDGLSCVFPMTAKGDLSAHAINATFAHLGDHKGFVKILFDPNIAPSRITRESAASPTPPAELDTTFAAMELTADTTPVEAPGTPLSLNALANTENN